jgi:hypothetical protein
MVDVMMAQAGITRQQASVALEAILYFVKTHPAEQLSRITEIIFNTKDDKTKSLN